jgi:hypothetical protein
MDVPLGAARLPPLQDLPGLQYHPDARFGPFFPSQEQDAADGGIWRPRPRPETQGGDGLQPPLVTELAGAWRRKATPRPPETCRKPSSVTRMSSRPPPLSSTVMFFARRPENFR